MSRCRNHLLSVALLPAVVATAGAADKVLLEKTSKYNTIIVSEDDAGLRTLRFEEYGARQSVAKVGDPNHLELVYSHGMLAGLAFIDQPNRVLVVGLGGGTIPTFLRAHFPDATIDAVEIDPDVVDVAKEYFGFREDAKMHAYVEDGRTFIEKRRDLYDLIYLDAYNADSIPYHLATREFLLAARQALTKNGVVAANLWSSSWNPSYPSMVRTYVDVFETTYLLDVPSVSNKILFASPSKEKINRRELAKQASRISTRQGFRFDLGSLIEQGLRSTSTESARGHVLLDKTPNADK